MHHFPRKYVAKQLNLALFVLLAGSIVIGCSESPKDEIDTPQPAQPATLRLQIIHPATREIQESIVGTGTIGATQTSNIGVVTPGIVERVFVKVGDRVKKGQPLFQTRKTDYEISVQLARAELTAAEARAEQARLDYERAKDLLDKNFISQAQLDTAGNSQRAADAETDVAQARLAQAMQRLADTVVNAPYDGVVTSRNVDEGTYKSAQTFSADGSVLQLKEIRVVIALVRIPEIYVTALQLGTPADIFIDGMGAVIQSDIWVINDNADSGSRTIEVRFALANDDYRIKPGLFVRAEIHPPGRKATLLARDAVLDRSGNPHVFLFADGIARMQPITVRQYDATSVEIVSGIDAGVSVLIGPDLIRLTDGDLIPGIADATR